MHRSSPATQLLRAAGSQRALPTPARFCLRELAGRMCELSGEGASCVLTLAMGLVLDAQRAGEPVAWVCRQDSVFYPPDAADSGIDLDALVVVRIEAAPSARGRAQTLAVAAERLLRSGAFGLIVIDLGKDAALAQPLQSRLLGLSQRHDSALLFLTDKSPQAASLGSLISLRAAAVRTWLGAERFACELRVCKDKRRGPVWSHSEVCRGPLGLR